MTSSAFSAQGATLEISSGTGSANTITDVFVGNPTILTCTAHGRKNGDSVALSNFAGTNAAVVNGKTEIVTNKTANTFAVQIDTTGLTVTDNTNTALATPQTYTAINNITSFNAFDGKAAIIDVTDLQSEAKEKRMGLQDFGKFSFPINIDRSDPGQAALIIAKSDRSLHTFKLTYLNGDVATFDAYTMSYPESGGVDKSVSGTVELEISGIVTYS